MVSILFVSTDTTQQDKIAGPLTERGYQLETAVNESTALHWLAQTHPSPRLIIIDNSPNSLALIGQLKAADSTTEIILLADPLKRLTATALQAGAYACVAMPLDLLELELVLQRAVDYSYWRAQAAEKQALGRAAGRQTHQFEALYGVNRQPEVELLEALAGQTAIAQENARLYSREADKLRRLELLARASGEIMGDLDNLSLEKRLRLIARHAAEILEVEACGISLVKRPGSLSFAAGYGYRPGCLRPGQEFAIQDKPGGGLTGYIAHQGVLFNMHGDQLVHHPAYGGSPSCTVSGQCYSLLAIPLKKKSGGKTDLIGLLRVDNKRDKEGRVGAHLSFSQEDEWIIQLFADAAVVALEAAKLFHVTEIARERLNRLYEEVRQARNTAKVVAEVTTLENVDNTLRSVATGTCEALKCDAVTLYGYDPIKESLTYPPILVGVRFPEKASSRPDIPRDHIALEILKGDRLYRVDDVATDPLFKRTRFAREEEIASCVGIPLKVGPEKVGVMFVNYRSPHQFTPEELANIELFAHQAAVAIRNANLYRQTQQHARQMAAIVEISRIINTSLDLDTALTTILHSIKPLIDYSAVEICLWNEQEGAMVVYGQAGDPRYTEQAGYKYAPGEGCTGWIAQHWQPLLIKDVANHTAVQPKVIDPERPIRSFLGVPLQAGEGRLGTLELVSDQPQAFNEADQKLLDIIAQQAIIAIKNARLFEAEQRRAEHLAALHQVAMAANSTLDISEIFRRVLAELLKLFKLDRGGVTLFDDEGGYGYTLIEAPERPQANVPLTLIPLADNPLVELLVSQKQPLGLEDASTDPRLNQMRGLVQHWRVKSMLAVPLVVKEKVLGMISLVSIQARRTFTPRDLTLAHTIINQVATAVENAQLYDQEQKRIRVLKTLYEASRVLISSFELEEILNNIVHQAWHLTIYRAKKISFASIRLVENMQTKLVAVYPREAFLKTQAAMASEQNGLTGIIGRAIKTGQAQLVGNVINDPEYRSVHPETRSELAVPIKIGYQIVGAINVEHPDYQAFDRDDQYALESLAAQAAIAIQNARLFKETERYARLLDAAAKVARGATRILDKAQLLNRVVELIVERFDFFYYAGVFLLDEKREYALLQAAYAEKKLLALAPDYRLRVGEEGIVGLVTRQGRPHLAANVKVNPYYLPHPDLPDTGAEMAFPLIVRGEVIGALDVQSRDIVNLKNEEIAALQTMADQLANAIHNAQQYEELKRAKLLVSARTGLAWLGMANSVWRHATDKHALTIREQTQLLRRHLFQLDLKEQKIVDRLAMIERLANKILEKPLTLPLTAEEGLEPVAVNELISERAKQLWQNDPYRPVELELDLQLPGKVMVSASPEWLRRAFDILVDNAVNAVAEREIQQVIIGSRQARGGAEIFVADTGPGLPETIREKIGLEFIEKSEDAKGMGMGLLMAQTIVQTYGGEIRVEATGPGGTVMVIWLPIKEQ